MDELENLKQSLIGLKALRNRLRGQIDQVEENIASLEKLIKTLEASVSVVEGGMPDNGSWSEKILFMLRASGESSPNQVAKDLSIYGRIFNNEDYKDEHYLNIASQYLPNLFKDGFLERRKSGRSYLYKLKEKK